MRKLFYLFLCLGLFSQLSAQNYLWNEHYKSVTSESIVSTKCIAIDNEGDVYATGHFQGTASFGDLEVMSNLNKPETYITKTSSDGELIWFKNLKGDDITARDIKIDQNGNIIIAGLFRGNLDFEGYTKFSIDTDVFILKLNNEGNVTWLITTETQNVEVNGEFINGITDFGGFDIDDSGNVYATGTFIGYVNFDPKETEILYSPSSPSEWGSSFILKITADGTLGWVQQVNQSFGTAVKVSNNDLYIGGNFYRGNVDLNPSPDEEYIVFTESFTEGYLIHMDTSGNFIKALHTRGDLFTSVTYWEIEADEFGNVYLVGDYFGNVTFSYDGLHQYETEHLNNGFVMKINNEGNIIWFSELKSLSSVVYSISLNEQQEAYITGSFSGYIDAENNTQLYQTNNNWFERYIAILDTEGNIIFNKGFAGGGESSDVKNSIKLKGDDIYLGGTFEGTVNLNPTDSMPVIVEAVGLDSYLIKLTDRNMNVEDLEKSNFILYPNPSNGIYNIQANAKISGHPYEVYDLSGKKLSSGKISRTNQIDLTLLPKGTYILKIDGKHSFKVIKR